MALVVAAVGWFVLIAGGCASTKVATPPSSYLVAVRYDVEPLHARLNTDAMLQEVDRDLRVISGLKFGAVVLDYLDDVDAEALFELANRHNLRVVLPVRSFSHFVRSGALPSEARRPSDLVARQTRRLVRHSAVGPLIVEVGREPEMMDRSITLCRLVRDAGRACVRVGDGNGESDADALIRIHAQDDVSDPDAPTVERWLSQFHRGLLAGQTAGIVFDRYRWPLDMRPGLVTRGIDALPARLAAIKHLVTRARLWGQRLHGATVEPITVMGRRARQVQAAVFSRGERRYVLLFNPSPNRFFRDAVLLPRAVGGLRVSRIVEVPSSAGKMPGPVAAATQNSRPALTVTLRPGDARLYEVF